MCIKHANNNNKNLVTTPIHYAELWDSFLAYEEALCELYSARVSIENDLSEVHGYKAQTLEHIKLVEAKLQLNPKSDQLNADLRMYNFSLAAYTTEEYVLENMLESYRNDIIICENKLTLLSRLIVDYEYDN